MAPELAINRFVLFRQREVAICSTPLRQAFDRPTKATFRSLAFHYPTSFP